MDPGRHRRALRRTLAAPIALWLAIGLAGCGGGGTSVDPAAPPPLAAGESAYDDPAVYSSLPDASLPGATEAAAVTRHRIVLGGTPLDYTARAGHLIAREPLSGVAQASMFYVAYTADGRSAAARPVTFFYNGGPGSASVWLHLGSFGPKRLATGVPGTAAARPFSLVDNAESLLDVTDLVFVNAVGTGLSQAIAPFVNRSFWGVDPDAALFRDFIVRWLAVNGRGASPRFLYGESYGGPRTAVLARLLQDSGVMLDALVLQSPALDYNSNCGVTGAAVGNCHGNLPTYGAIGAFHRLTRPVPTDLDAYTTTLRDLAATRYRPAVDAFLQGLPPPSDLLPVLADSTGLAASQWSQQFNLAQGTFQSRLLAGQLIGRYDGRMAAPNGSTLTAEGDPSSAFISASFASAIPTYLRESLRYTSGSTYVVLSNAIAAWDFSHAGRGLPDTVPDLAAALAQNPALRILAVNGYHDLATPFRVTELDLARLGNQPRVTVRNYPGGHMTYLDDATRVRQKADLVSFFQGTLAERPVRQAPLSLRARPGADAVGVPAATGAADAQRREPEQALQAPLRDPWVPTRRPQAGR